MKRGRKCRVIYGPCIFDSMEMKSVIDLPFGVIYEDGSYQVFTDVGQEAAAHGWHPDIDPDEYIAQRRAQAATAA